MVALLGWFVLLGFPHYVPIFDVLSQLFCSFIITICCSGGTVCAGKITRVSQTTCCDKTRRLARACQQDAAGDFSHLGPSICALG